MYLSLLAPRALLQALCSFRDVYPLVLAYTHLPPTVTIRDILLFYSTYLLLLLLLGISPSEPPLPMVLT